jgi:hypothetical protein
MKKRAAAGRYGWMLLGLLLGLALALWLSLLLGSAPSWLMPTSSGAAFLSEPVGALGPINLDWDQPTAPRPEDFRLDSGVGLELQWQSGLLTIIPRQPLPLGEQRLTYQPAAEPEAEWRFEVRAAEPLFLQQAGGRRRLYRWNDGNPQLLSADHNVVDYEPSWQGDRIAYSAANSQGGSDLWLVDRSGRARQLLVSCGQEQCRGIAWTPAADRITFTRYLTQAPGQSRLWTVDPAGGMAAPLYQSEARHGRDPVWSPDGRWLTYYDVDASGVRLLDADTLEEQIVPSRAGLSGAWSGDSQSLFLPLLVFRGGEPVTQLYQLQIADRELKLLLGEQAGWRQVGEPALGLTGEWLALAGQRGSAAASLWLVPLKAGEARPVAMDPAYSYGGPSWDASGQQLLFQRFPLGAGEGSPDLLIWSAEHAEPQLLREGAGSADWLQ